MNKNIFILSGLLFILANNCVFPQVNSSPYTLFGSGQIMDKGFGMSDALGGTGIGFQSKYALNNLNPSSYSSLDSLTFLFESGIYLKFNRFESNQQTSHSMDGNLRYLAFGCRITNWWASSIGIIPFSSIGYKFNTTDNIEGEQTTFTKMYSGTGGINQYYIGNAFNIGKHLALGFNTSYIHGSVTQTEKVESIENYSGFKLERTSYVTGFLFDYGMQVNTALGNLNYCAGITFGNQKDLTTRTESFFGNNDDTIPINPATTDYMIPKRFGVGFSVTKENKFCFGADYSKENWSVAEYNNPYLETRNGEKISFGIDYKPGNGLREYGFRNLNYRIGGYFKATYLVIDNIPANTAALTFGFGIPLRKQFTKINIAAEIGQTGSLKHGLIKENFCLININFSLRDRWFLKPQYD